MKFKRNIKDASFTKINSNELIQTGDKTYKKNEELEEQKKYTKLPIAPETPPKKDDDYLTEQEKIEIIDEVFAPKDPPPKICFNCGKQVHEDEYYTYYHNREIYICHTCFKMMPRCKHCGIPIKKTTLGVSMTHCQFCKPKNGCNICGKTLTMKTAIFLPGVRGSFCMECLENAPICYGCGKPETKDIIKLNDGRYFCNDCNTRSIITEDQAYKVNHDIVYYLKMRCEYAVSEDFVIYLKDYSEEEKEKWDHSFYKWKYVDSEQYLFVFFATPANHIIKTISEHYAKQLFKLICPNNEYSAIRFQAFTEWFSYYMCFALGYPDDYHYFIMDNINTNPIINRFFTLEKRVGLRRVLNKINKEQMRWE